MPEPAFGSERELQRYLASVDLTANGGYSSLYVRRELPVGPAIPDIIYVGFKTAPVFDLLPVRWSYQHTQLVWQLRRRSPLHYKTLARRSFQRAERTLRYLEEMEQSGALERLGTGAFALSPSVAAIDAEVVAVEVKLRQWRDALRQARSYEKFADKVVVAMDGLTTPTKPAVVCEFRRLGVGLAAASPDGITWYAEPKNQPPVHGPEREYLVASACDSRRQTAWSCL